MRARVLAVVAVLAMLAGLTLAHAPPAAAATVPPGFVDQVLASGLDAPTAMALAPDGRVFIAQQGGAIRIVTAGGALLGPPFATLATTSTGERGLIGIALDPAFASNHFVYVHYTTTAGGRVHNRVARLTASGNTAVAGSHVTLVDDLPTLGPTNHNGGGLNFGPDGKLYIAVGENATASNAQTLANPLGKILRVNRDGTIPSDNPFFGSTTGRSRAIWALGLRNPFTFAFRPGTGELFINDVGAGAFEEVNRGVRGGNYGWPDHEGPGGEPTFVDPVHAYGHGETSTTGCAIAGGAFYDPVVNRFGASFTGDYFFADLCSGWIRRWDRATGTTSLFLSGRPGLVDLRVTPDGALLYLARNGGTLGKVSNPGTSRWLLRNAPSGGPAQINFVYGIPSDRRLACDWDGDDIAEPVVVRGAMWHLRSTTAGGAADLSFGYGSPGDQPVCGDWDGDGDDTPGVRRGNAWLLRNVASAGPATVIFGYGRASDLRMVGDWDGDGDDTPGLRRGNTWLLRNALAGGAADVAFTYGRSSDAATPGDWDGDGDDTPGVRRANTWILRNALGSGAASAVFTYGATSDQPMVGDWDGDGGSDVGVTRTSG